MINIVALTEPGLSLAKSIQCQLNQPAMQFGADTAEITDNHPRVVSQILYKPQPFMQVVQSAFNRGESLILICAMGIAVRTLAPVIKSKRSDPPVLVLDERGKFVVPLLSGHEGGANEWGRKISSLIESQLVITTANSYLKPVYTIGLGCERDCPESYLEELITDCLAEHKLSMNDIHSFHSIDIKADEVSIISLATRFQKDYLTWEVSDLLKVEHMLSTKSDYVFNTVGVYGVAESAALVGAMKVRQTLDESIPISPSVSGDCHDERASNLLELVQPKVKNAKATCAIARSFAANNH